jgi:hypothetical protein
MLAGASAGLAGIRADATDPPQPAGAATTLARASSR